MLCEACDKVLLSDPQITRIAIPWLHVLNEHPLNLVKYKDILLKNPKPSYSFKSALYQFSSLWKSKGIKKSKSTEKQVTDVLFISHLLNEGQIGNSEDFYFGNLPEILKEKGIKSNLVLINHTSKDLSEMSSCWSSEVTSRFILAKSLSIRGEFTIRRKLRQESKLLRRSAASINDELQKRVSYFAAQEAVSVSTISTMRIFLQVQELCERFKPKAIVVTYEGHAWERLVFSAGRASRSDIKCIGYNHSILFPKQHAALRPLNSSFDPDIILTAGDITQRHFQRHFPQASVYSMGIHRRMNAVTPNTVSDRQNNCLVIPDGSNLEVVFMFDFAISAAKLNPDINYIFRLHPVISKDQLLLEYPRFASLPINIELSNRSISEDFNLCRWAIYRGSNASIYAVISGLRPFYIKKDDELPIDCLFEVNSWKKVVSHPEGLIIQIQNDIHAEHDALEAEAKETQDYCNSFFKPLNEDLLLELLNTN